MSLKTRRGFTLIELSMALLVTLLVLAIGLGGLVRQLRAYAGLSAASALHTQLRDGPAILVSDLRSLSISDTLPFASDSALEIDALIGTATLCRAPTPTQLDFTADSLASGAPMTSWLVTPDTGDYAVVFHDSTLSSPSRGWERAAISSVSATTAGAACPPSYGLTTPSDVISIARVVNLSSPVLAPTRGSPVRFLRRGRYSVYRASDGERYLGYRRCGPAGCATVQPLSGPYRSVAGIPQVEFRYFASNGARIVASGPVTGVARIDLVFRAATDSGAVLPGEAGFVHSDSAIASVAMRNRL